MDGSVGCAPLDTFASLDRALELFLNEPVARAPGSHGLVGELVGSFRVLREIGQGGMADVYLAERADGQISQQVALKILRIGLAGSQAQLHFAQERQILASLDHQSIARLIDAGVTATGLPYFAMEYVEGVAIDRYCDEQRLDIDARLQLFLKVAEALRYASRRRTRRLRTEGSISVKDTDGPAGSSQGTAVFGSLS